MPPPLFARRQADNGVRRARLDGVVHDVRQEAEEQIRVARQRLRMNRKFKSSIFRHCGADPLQQFPRIHLPLLHRRISFL